MNILYANDRPGCYPASYYHASAKELENHPSLDHDIKCDVCVIGAGYTGISAALHLAEKGYDVVIIDAHKIGWGASGRNGGQLASGQRVEQPELENLLGRDIAKSLWGLGQNANQLVRKLIDHHQIDCDFKSGVIHANHRERYTKHTRDEVEHMSKVYAYDKLSFLDKSEIQSILSTDAYHSGSLDMGAAHLHPLKLAFGLARAAKKADVKIYERTHATAVEQSDPAMVKTANGNITANFVIFACNGYLGDLENKAARHVMPINNFIIATEPLSEKLASELIANDAAIADSKFVINYYRLSADRRLLFGGGENYSYKFPSDIKNFVRNPMLEIYPQLRETKIDYGWGGTLSITMNRLPYIKRLKPNILTAGGYSGEGLGMGIFAGSLLADTIDGTASGFDIMAAIPNHKFPGGQIARAPLLALAMLYYSLRDKF